VNALTRERLGEIQAYDSLYAPIEGTMHEEDYGNWETVVNEHIIRATEVRLAYRQYGEAAGRRVLEDQKERGFQYVEPLANRLKAYEENRDRYPQLSDFYPRLIAVFDSQVSNER